MSSMKSASIAAGVAPRTQILIIRDQDREVLVNKKLKQAQRLYEKNQQGRAAFMQHIGSALKQPALTLAAEAAALSSTENRTLAQHADELVKLIDDIQLANLLESDASENQPDVVLGAGAY